MCVRETSISYEELHDKLTDFEAVIKQQEASPMAANFFRRNKGFESSQQLSSNRQNSGGNNSGYRGNNQSFNQRCSTNQSHRRPNQYDSNNSRNRPVCQLCNKVGHIARNCWNYNISRVHENTANMVQNSYPFQGQTWVMDSGASTHATNDLENLSLYRSDYGGCHAPSLGVTDAAHV